MATGRLAWIARQTGASTSILGLLKAVALPSDTADGAWIAPWLERAQRENGWLILYTHDVSAAPTPL